MWKIKKSVLLNAILAANNYLPEEFVCLLGGNKKSQEITEIVFVPSETSEDAASINTLSIPFDETILGSLHSHPYSSGQASTADKTFFSKYPINAILGHPYTLENVIFFDEKGKAVQVLIVEG
ncbi:MAG: Mov34/MPN/PAD-1 family protein [archaeon]|jgi:proteasome lid subunit RPN8/RPN11